LFKLSSFCLGVVVFVLWITVSAISFSLVTPVYSLYVCTALFCWFKKIIWWRWWWWT